MTRSSFALTIAIATTLVGPLTTAAQAQKPLTPPLVISSLSGRDLFQFYCATCHGRGGRGDGPVAASLQQRPPDLTAITRRHEGRFPTQAIERLVTGDDLPVAAHGSREMPVWGPIFRSLEPHDRLTAVRIANVVAYLESIQEPGNDRPAADK
jgi:mono/diheme cytochrome c family protein